jgi:hypothetical protein
MFQNLASGVAVSVQAARLNGSGATCAPFHPPDDSLFRGKDTGKMSQQPPLRPGDRVRFIYDRDHVETVESCEFITDAPRRHWQVVTTWDGNRRIADAKEYVIEGVGP